VPDALRHRSGLEARLLLASDGSRVVMPFRGSPPWDNTDLWIWDLARDVEQTRTAPVNEARMREAWSHGPRGRDFHAALSADGRRAFSVSSWRTLLSWDLEDPGPPRDGDLLHEVDGIAVTADAAHIVLLSSVDTRRFGRLWNHATDSLRIVSAADGRTVAEMLLERMYDCRLAASPDARNILLLDKGIRFIEWVQPPAAG